MEFPVDQGHPYGAYAAVMIASEGRQKSLPLPVTQIDGLQGLDYFDGDIYIEPGVPFQIHEGFVGISFDPRTHPGIIEQLRFLDYDAGLGRDILLGGQDPETGLWYIRIDDLEIIDVQGVPTPFHFPHRDRSEQFWGEAHIIDEEDSVTIVLIPQAPYVENY